MPSVVEGLGQCPPALARDGAPHGREGRQEAYDECGALSENENGHVDAHLFHAWEQVGGHLHDERVRPQRRHQQSDQPSGSGQQHALEQQGSHQRPLAGAERGADS